MNKYLGEKTVNIKRHPEFSKYSANQWVMLFIEMYGQIDGSHHKTLLLDQVAQILKGTKVIVKVASWDNGHKEFRFYLDTPSKKYLKWVEYMKGELDENGDYEYSYNNGVNS